MTRSPALALLVVMLIPACTPTGPEVAQAEILGAQFLLGSDSLPEPVSTAAFEPSQGGEPANRFEGRLELEISPGEGRMRVLTDWFNYQADSGLQLEKLPPFNFQFVQDGEALVPVLRGHQRSSHPHWEWILEPGRVWDDPRDEGWTRASLPFSLQERNANCIHNGLLSFLFRSDGSISRAAYQVGSETCQYFQLDLWGVVDASYTPGVVENARQVITAYSEEVASRLPVKPLQDLAADYPGSDPARFDWYPSDEVSTLGFAIDGVHYSAGCETRYGPYPYCEVLDLPSYSLAKSIFAAAAYMALEQETPGAGELRVDRYVSECAGDERWRGVTLQHLLDMSTGNFQSLEHNADEFASYETEFMSGESHSGKINTACGLFPRKAEPGTRFAYHTSDTYIAGAVMNEFLSEQAASSNRDARDIHTGVLVEQVMKPLGLSPVTWHTRRTRDQEAQPFTGYGLTLHSDDIVRLGLFLARGDGIIQGEQVLDPGELNAALQRDPLDPGLESASPDIRYNNGFWAFRTDLNGSCRRAVWIPLMSGYGGISIILLPNQSLFYVFSDKGRFEWLSAAVESNKIRGFCE